MSISRTESGFNGLGKAGLIALFQSLGLQIVQRGVGTPEGAVVGKIGDLYVATNGGATTTLYVKTSGTGNTGWTAK